MFGESGGRLFGATLLGAAVLTAASIGAVQYFANNATAPIQVARAAPVKQSIAGLKSVLDPLTTGSVPRNASIILDPCTGARKS